MFLSSNFFGSDATDFILGQYEDISLYLHSKDIGRRSCCKVAQLSKKVVFGPPIFRGGIPKISEFGHAFQMALTSEHVPGLG